MAAANYQRAEEQFLCSICLEVFTHPVSTPCGHNFCKSCITQHWETSNSSQCPMCKKLFDPKPELQVNTSDLELREETKKPFQEAELRRVQQYEVDVTLDPETANPGLVLSEDKKQVYDCDEEKDLPDNPKRFDKCACVLGKQSFSSGRFYFEVQVEGKTDWILGVVRESINRKGDITLSPEDGLWSICCANEHQHIAIKEPPVYLSLRSPLKKVGVFVDYEEGLVSFYDVDSADLIYSFTDCSFTEKLYPYFSPGLNDEGTNSAPLIISPVKVK